MPIRFIQLPMVSHLSTKVVRRICQVIALTMHLSDCYHLFSCFICFKFIFSADEFHRYSRESNVCWL